MEKILQIPEVILFYEKKFIENWKILYIVKNYGKNDEKIIYIIQKKILKKVQGNRKNVKY